MTHFFTPPIHKNNQVEEEYHTPGRNSLTANVFSRDHEAYISNCNKTPLCSSSSSSCSSPSESKKETTPDMDSNNKSLDKDSSGKRKSTDGEEDSINKKMKTTPTSPQSPTTGINNTNDSSHSIIKMLGPLHLPDFRNSHEIDLHLLQLKSELASTNSQLRKSNSQKPSPPSLLLPLTTRRQRIISDLIRENPTFNPSNKTTTTTHSKLCRKLYIPVRKYPNHNFIGPIIGPRGQNQKRMQRETGARINVRGRGASRSQQHEHMHPDSSDDLHVYIEAETQQSLDSATAMVEKMLLLPRAHQPEETTQVEVEEEEDNDDEYVKKKKKKDKEKVVEMESSSIYVANLPHGVEEGELQRMFSSYGEINSTRVMRDRCTGCSRGYGFVNFESSEAAAMAVKMLNGKSVGGKVMVVRMSEVKSSVWVEKEKMAVVPPMLLQPRAFVPSPHECSGPCWFYENNGGGGGSSSDDGRRRMPFCQNHILSYPFYSAAPAPVNPPVSFSSN